MSDYFVATFGVAVGPKLGPFVAYPKKKDVLMLERPGSTSKAL